MHAQIEECAGARTVECEQYLPTRELASRVGALRDVAIGIDRGPERQNTSCVSPRPLPPWLISRGELW